MNLIGILFIGTWVPTSINIFVNLTNSMNYVKIINYDMNSKSSMVIDGMTLHRT
jgi:hypothetical protein